VDGSCAVCATSAMDASLTGFSTHKRAKSAPSRTMSTAGTSACRAAIHHARTPSAHLLILLGYAFGGGLPGLVTGAKRFLPLWLIGAALSIPIFLGIFGVPALVAGLVWWKFP